MTPGRCASVVRAGNTALARAASTRAFRQPLVRSTTPRSSTRSRSTTASIGCPKRSTFARWAGQAPPGFLYAVKASRFLTHMKKLKDPGGAAPALLRPCRRARAVPRPGALPAAAGLAEGQVERLAALPGRPAARASATRSSSATRPGTPPEVLDLLQRARRGAVPARHARLGHGAHGGGVRSCMCGSTGRPARTPAGIRRDRLAVVGWLAERSGAPKAVDVYAYFNNDVGGHAPVDALTLRRMMETDR